MNLLTQMLPGLREVRAPLVAGYLWLFAGWLLLADRLPGQDDAEAYSRAFEIGDAVGRAGLIAVASVGAYLVGSLLRAVPEWISHNWALLARRVKRGSFHPPPDSQALPRMRAIDLLNDPPFHAPTDFRRLDGDHLTGRVVEELVLERLGAARHRLGVALVDAGRKVRLGAESTGLCTPTELSAATAAIDAVGGPGVGWATKSLGAMVHGHPKMREINVSLPSFSAARDIFGERVAIQARLMETTKHAGSEVERLYAESDFRFTVAPPVAAVGIILAAESASPWWLLLLGAAAGLLTHAAVLRRHAGRELVEALRSRPIFDELDRITPVFVRYERNVSKVVDKFAATDWEELGALAKLKPEPTATPLSP